MYNDLNDRYVQDRKIGLVVASAVIRKYKLMFVHGYQKNGKQLFLLCNKKTRLTSGRDFFVTFFIKQNIIINKCTFISANY